MARSYSLDDLADPAFDPHTSGREASKGETRAAMRARAAAADAAAIEEYGEGESLSQRLRFGARERAEPTAKRAASQGAGFLLGLTAYALVLAWIQYGPEGPKAWIAAKFLNRPWDGPARTPGPAATPAAPSPAAAPSVPGAPGRPVIA